MLDEVNNEAISKENFFSESIIFENANFAWKDNEIFLKEYKFFLILSIS
jgi:hypothetical protein